MLKSNRKGCDEMSTTKNFFRASAEDFKKIPGSPIAYWVGRKFSSCFLSSKLGDMAEVITGMTIGDNNKYLRFWSEVSFRKIALKYDAITQIDLQKNQWIPYSKGGARRNWYGNYEYVVNWAKKDSFNRAKTTLSRLYLKEALTWPFITSGSFSARYLPSGSLWDVAGSPLFIEDKDEMWYILSFLCSKVANYILKVVNPTINVQAIDLHRLPIIKIENRKLNNSLIAISCSRFDWDSYETSWDFKVNPLLELRVRGTADEPLSVLYSTLRAKWATACEEMQRLETENNRIFIEAYGLEEELTPEVPWHEITLTCNPWYRYGVKFEGDSGQELGVSGEMPMDEALEERLRADTVKELISYAVGCMMGRYSLAKPGLILANQGSSMEDFMLQHETHNSQLTTLNSNFLPDADGIIPVLEDDCFADDVVTQFHKFLRVAFGERHFNENLTFVETALGKDVRSYFVKDFYADHLQRYQKRPIYWLYSSPKGTFSALVYMHRHNPGTAGQVLAYLRSHITKIQSRIEAADGTLSDADATPAMKTRSIKERGKLARQLKELEDYERDVLHPVASRRIDIDLDDGVRKNYPMFGAALRKIPGMGKEES